MKVLSDASHCLVLRIWSTSPGGSLTIKRVIHMCRPTAPVFSLLNFTAPIFCYHNFTASVFQANQYSGFPANIVVSGRNWPVPARWRQQRAGTGLFLPLTAMLTRVFKCRKFYRSPFQDSTFHRPHFWVSRPPPLFEGGSHMCATNLGECPPRVPHMPQTG